MINKSIEFKKRQDEIISKFNDAGIKVIKDKREPLNGKYSGILSCEKKVLVITLPN